MEAGDAVEWLLHAESDLTYAKLGQVQPAILRNQVAFHAEQAAEKAFKAVLVHAAVEFPRTHDLQSLLLLLRNNGISVRPEIEEASALTRFAVEARYPGDIEPITREEVALAIEIAERAVAWDRHVASDSQRRPSRRNGGLWSLHARRAPGGRRQRTPPILPNNGAAQSVPKKPRSTNWKVR